jgi:hypothetical protein
VHQVKIFKGLETELPALETQINDWLAANAIRVINIIGNMAPQSPPPEKTEGIRMSPWPPSDVIVIVHYDK